MSIPPGTFSNALQIFMVVQTFSGGGGSLVHRTLYSSATNANPLFANNNPGYIQIAAGSNAAWANGFQFNGYSFPNKPVSIVNVNMNQSSFLNSGVSFFVNGTNYAQTGLAGMPARWIAYDGGDMLSLLGQANPVTNVTPAILYEFLIYNTPLTSNQRITVEGYLSRKWRLSINATNPYGSNYVPWQYITTIVGPAGPSPGTQGPQGPAGQSAGVTIQYGTGTTNASATLPVTFVTPFSNTPAITANVANGSNAWVTVGSASSNGFSAYTWNVNGAFSNVAINWNAMV